MSNALRRGDARFVTKGDSWVGRCCFSYAEHYDPANVSFGRMLACNEFVLDPGAGFGVHRHAGLDIVTTVLSGTLTHVQGDARELRPPGTYLLRTGDGVEHDERNETAEPVRFVQAWFTPGTANPRPDRHLLKEGTSLLVRPTAHLLVLAGELADRDDRLAEGDSLRVTEPAALQATTASDVLVWPC